MNRPEILDIQVRRDAQRPAFIAFYLPQFHPIPENDEWWGRGFTEWINVVQARPRYRGHYQPHVPSDLGFYDLRLREARQAQADLAAAHGIDGFCYYHYWFNGRRPLGHPFDEVRRLGQPALPFCLCWANENWTRRWDGLDKDVLWEQVYSVEDDRQHGRWLAEAFSEPRYIRVEGRPLFLVYRPILLPDPKRFTDTVRDEVTRTGLPEPYICRVESLPGDQNDPTVLGFDAGVEFQPDWRFIPSLSRRPATRWALSRLGRRAHRGYVTFPYRRLLAAALREQTPDYVRFRCVTPSWDNTPRRKATPFILESCEPQLYEHWLYEIATSTPHGAVFVNAWNEWGEGCHLEPCLQRGRAYLEAHRAVAELMRSTVENHVPVTRDR